MKINMLMTAFAVSFALVTTGCKYDKAADGAGADGAGAASDISTTGEAGGIDSAADANAAAIANQDSQTGSLTDAMAGGRFEDLYTKCSDVEFEPIYFGFDSTVVPGGELGKIDSVVQHLQAQPNRVVVVEGHCDERGSNEYNMSLGENRAIIIRNYLVQNGIVDGRIQTRSYGAEKPAAEGHDENAWARNRRGEFGIYQK